VNHITSLRTDSVVKYFIKYIMQIVMYLYVWPFIGLAVPEIKMTAKIRVLHYLTRDDPYGLTKATARVSSSLIRLIANHQETLGCSSYYRIIKISLTFPSASHVISTIFIPNCKRNCSLSLN
jgi:hypothetical protein